jgi:CDP-diacylglycerol--serine O-phosphatidyltransferase
MFSVLPTLLTLGNAACGFGSITFAAKVGPDHVGGHDLFISALLIFLAMLFDMLDGSVARWAKHTTDFGAQLDSLCDGLSFGVAPAFLMLRFNHSMVGLVEQGLDAPTEMRLDPFITYHPRLLWVIGALFALCALLRLARFNVETEEDDSHEYFSGLPSPAAAATVASFPIAMNGLRQWADTPGSFEYRVMEWLIPAAHVALPLITLCVAVLMVSRFKYAHVFNQFFRGQRSRTHLIQLIFTIAAVFLVREMAMPLIFCVFAFTPPVRACWSELVHRRRLTDWPIANKPKPEP